MTTTMPEADARPWTEKYRPQQLRGVAFQSVVVKVLQTTLGNGTDGNNASVKASDVPNILFYGPPGTGKTTTAHAIAREWFPTPQLFRDRVLELNASDDRGIVMVRAKVIRFARQPVMPDPTNRVPPFRLLILDEADAMTENAQASLRRVMERYSTHTRFFLLCNYLSGLLAPLVSRCAAFYFRSPSPPQMAARLDKILRREQLLLGANDEEHMQILLQYADHSDGDMRKALHWLQCLQSMWRAKRLEEEEKRATSSAAIDARCSGALAKEVLSNMSARPPEHVVQWLVAQLLLGQLTFAAWYERLAHDVHGIGYSTVACLQMICDALLDAASKNQQYVGMVTEYLERLSEIDAALHKGADGQLQMASLYHPLVAALK